MSGYRLFCKSLENSSPRKVAVGAADPRPRVYDIVALLSVWFGFCDDYRKIILSCKHELIPNRSRTSLDCVKVVVLELVLLELH